MRKIKFGGLLEKGDFIVVSYSNYLTFGWYIGDGQGGSLQFYSYSAPSNAKKHYDDYIANPKKSNWRTKYYKNGFTIKCLYKDYIISVDSHRICKINPMDIFTKIEEMIIFEKSREVLIDLNFIQR